MKMILIFFFLTESEEKKISNWNKIYKVNFYYALKKLTNFSNISMQVSSDW